MALADAAIVSGHRYLQSLLNFVELHSHSLIQGTLVLKLNPAGLRYVQSRLAALAEVESLSAGAPVDYFRAYVSDLGDHRALEHLRRILRLLPSLTVASVLPPPSRDTTPLNLFLFRRLKVLELRGCDLSTSAAMGLLELRFSLEKLICHNSTDALRHVFASRIAEIKDSHQWSRLSFVSCACNGLVLMDESLQLLPAVETLDLSRNKFEKAINLQKCIKLKHLDLGFNSRRSIESFNEVSCQIVKLVLRNNALTKLHGIEHMKSLQGLDLSYNIISSFSEVEILAGLPSLQNLWLEGNPICCTRWFRARVFSLFSHPQKLNLDEKRISACELWQQWIIVASKRKRPSSFGFYSPAKEESCLTGNMSTKKRISHLVSFGSGVQRPSSSGQGSVSIDIEMPRRYETGISDEDNDDIEQLMRKIEYMKKEHSVLWLLEFKKWMNETADCSIVDGSELSSFALCNKEEFHLDKEKQDKDLSATSRDIPHFVQLFGHESNTIILDSDAAPFIASTADGGKQQFNQIAATASENFIFHTVRDRFILNVSQGEPKTFNGEMCVSADAGKHCTTELVVHGEDSMDTKNAFLSIESSSSLACTGSPPRYQESVLYQPHHLEEEFLHISAESLSVASSDSNTSCSEDDSGKLGLSIIQVFNMLLTACPEGL